LLCDENVHPDVVLRLRTEDFDVLYVKEGALRGSDDAVILRRAYEGGVSESTSAVMGRLLHVSLRG
jgi:hypothetical protein